MQSTERVSAPVPACPHEGDADRTAIWTMLVRRDIDAFVAADWTRVAGDFVSDGFLGLDARNSADPADWQLAFPQLARYRQSWLQQARQTAATDYAQDVRTAIYAATSLARIDIDADTAVAHKRFDGRIGRSDGGADVLAWRTLYFCRRQQGTWKISGFVGYLPLHG